MGKDCDFRQHSKKKPEGDEEVSHDMGSCLTSWRKNITACTDKEDKSSK